MDNAVVEMKEPLVSGCFQIGNELRQIGEDSQSLKQTHCQRMAFRQGEIRFTCQTTMRCWSFKDSVLSVMEKAETLTKVSGDSVR